MKKRPDRGGPRAKYVRHRQVAPSRFDPRSFRTIKCGPNKCVVGCLKGKYDVKRGRCRVGMRVQTILKPKRSRT